MQTHASLIRNFINSEGSFYRNDRLNHATLASIPRQSENLRLAVKSLISQVDTLHVYLNGFDTVPDFLDHEKIYITRSRDFGYLGECGKYYWVNGLAGYHFICSDSLIYPDDYISKLRQRLDEFSRRIITGYGGYRLTYPVLSFNQSASHLSEFDKRSSDIEADILNDSCLAFHSETLRVSRHRFFQPGLSSFWLAILAKEQDVGMLCISNSEIALLPAGNSAGFRSEDDDSENHRTFMLKTYFDGPGPKPAQNEINAWFDRIYVMNLDRRADRWEKVHQRLINKQINFVRIPAVDGYANQAFEDWTTYFNSRTIELPEGLKAFRNPSEKSLRYDHHIKRVHFMESALGHKAIRTPGAWGYALTYIHILREAIKKDLGRILIFDDDIILHKRFNEEFTARMAMLPDDWMLIMLGAMQHHWEPTWITWANDALYHCNGSSIASHAVGLDRKAFLPVLYYAQKLDLPIDEGAIYHIQNVFAGKSFIFYPNIAIQDVSESDINSSALSPEDIVKKNNLFRWDYTQYDI